MDKQVSLNSAEIKSVFMTTCEQWSWNFFVTKNRFYFESSANHSKVCRTSGSCDSHFSCTELR